MRRCVIRGGQVDSPAMLHAALRQGLRLPAYYGDNLDALWDVLTGQVALPLEIKWVQFARSQALLGDYADRAWALMVRAARQRPGLRLRRYAHR